MSKSWLKNKTVIISGVSGGLGLNIAKLLIEKYNCNIIGICRNEEKMKKAILNYKLPITNFSYNLFDVSIKENWIDFANKLKSNGITPDLLINNAGFMLPFKKFEHISDEEIDRIINTDLTSVIYSVKYLIPLLKKSKSPSIFNISSAAGMLPVVGESMYCTVKYGVRGFTETLRQDYKKEFYYIGGAYPGFIRTNILDAVSLPEKERKTVIKMMTPVEKASKKIVRGISRKKAHIVTGFGGFFINYVGKVFPKLSASVMTFVLRKSKMSLFKDVFDNYN